MFFCYLGVPPLIGSTCAVATTPKDADSVQGANANMPKDVDCTNVAFKSNYFCTNCVDYNDNNIPVGTMVGIILGSICGVLLIVGIIVIFCVRHRGKKKTEEAEKMAKVVVLDAPVPAPLYGEQETELGIVYQSEDDTGPYGLPGTMKSRSSRHAGAYAAPDLSEYGMSDTYGASQASPSQHLAVGHFNNHHGDRRPSMDRAWPHSSGAASPAGNQPARRATVGATNGFAAAAVLDRINKRENEPAWIPPSKQMEPVHSEVSKAKSESDFNPYGYGYSGVSSVGKSTTHYAVGGFTGPYPVMEQKPVKSKSLGAPTPKQQEAAKLGVGTVGSWKQRQKSPPPTPSKFAVAQDNSWEDMQNSGGVKSNPFQVNRKGSPESGRRRSFTTAASTPRGQSSWSSGNTPTQPQRNVNKRLPASHLQNSPQQAPAQKRFPGYEAFH